MDWIIVDRNDEKGCIVWSHFCRDNFDYILYFLNNSVSLCYLDNKLGYDFRFWIIDFNYWFCILFDN